MTERARRYKYLDVLTTLFVVILLVSNRVAQKICMLGPFAVTGAVLLFPITYIFGDVFTEVCGSSASRRAIWLGCFGTALLYPAGSRRCAAGRSELEEGVRGGLRVREGSLAAPNISRPFSASFSHRGAYPYHQTSHRVGARVVWVGVCPGERQV